MLEMDIYNSLISGIKKDDYLGWDPFDGLNAPIVAGVMGGSKYIRLSWIQFLKKAPVNFRSALCIPKGYNPKGLALILSSLLLIDKRKYHKEIDRLTEIIIQLRSKDEKYYCWGYNFPWEARAFSVSRWKSNMIASSFVAQAFLDLYESNSDNYFLDLSCSVGDFIMAKLLLTHTNEEICFGYIPGEKTKVHNANLMGAKLFARLYYFTKENKYKEIALKSANYSANRQQLDGAWVYGEQKHHQWIDNFHSGFNLVAIYEIQRYLKTNKWQTNLDIGLSYHLKHHYLANMTPKYYNNHLYPIDIHNYSQGIITLVKFKLFKEVELLINNCLEKMWDRNRKYFYYQINRYNTNKINYLRWSQAWMLYSLSIYLKKNNE